MKQASEGNREPGKRMLLYPWLVSLYPVVALLGQNVDQVSLSAGLRPLAVSVLLMAAALLIGRLLFRDWGKAAAAATLGFALFFSYGHIYTFVERINATGLVIGRHRYLLPLWAGLFILGIWRILRAKDVRRWAPALNVVAGFALVIPVLQIAWYEARSGLLAAQSRAAASDSCVLRPPEGQPLPDVYYIILDGYMRDDVLREISGYDNTPFLNSLSEMGFVVARQSQSNYPWTDMSLASSMNLEYLEQLGWDEPSQDWALGKSLIVHSELRRELECLGYTTVSFPSGYWFTEWNDADYFLSPHADTRDRLGLSAGISGFEWMWINTSVGLALGDAEQAFARWFPVDFHERGEDKRELIEFVLGQLPSIAAGRGPKLVFIHIVAPHSPFVFGPNGEHIFFTGVGGPPAEWVPGQVHPYWQAYAGQTAHLNTLVLEAVRGILSRSSTPPIIVIQGDHGYVGDPPDAKPPILNAYYLPEGGGDLVYDELTPVNTFRLILTRYFGGDYPLLEDVSYCTLPGVNDIGPDPCIWQGSVDPLQ